MSTHLSQEEEIKNLGEVQVNAEADALEVAPEEAV